MNTVDSTRATSINSWGTVNNGQRIDFGEGYNDYLTSTGTKIACGAPLDDSCFPRERIFFHADPLSFWLSVVAILLTLTDIVLRLFHRRVK